MKLAIVGAGWYGCHIANYLRSLGHETTVFERNATALDEASGRNQNRLHLGFHYARDYETRMQSRDGYSRFLERYGALTLPVRHNYYAVASQDSLLDFKTYKTIMASSGIEFRGVQQTDLPFQLQNVSGVLETDERVIDEIAARQFFEIELAGDLRLDHPVAQSDIEVFEDKVLLQGQRYDYLVDATWSKLFPLRQRVIFEPTLLLYYRNLGDDFALTLVDGPLASIYPTAEADVATLSSVTHTPLGQYSTAEEATQCLASLTHEEVADCRFRMEEEILAYLPDFNARFEYLGPQLSMKTKPLGRQDNRSCSVEVNGRLIQVMSGKIDTIFFATERILSAISIQEKQQWTYSSGTAGLSDRPWRKASLSTARSTAKPFPTSKAKRLIS
jgi:hypothetical protein